MNDQQLEAVLRRSLARHADTVDSGPTWPPADDVLAGNRDRHRPPASWWAVAAAVAAVLAVIGAVVVIRHLSSDRSRPATPIVTRTGCATELPPTWRAAIRAGTLPSNVEGPITGRGPDGEVLVSTEKHLVLIRPDGSTQPVANIPFERVYGMGAGTGPTFDQRWILVGRVAESLHPTAKIDLIDRRTLRTREIASVPAPNGAAMTLVLFDGHAYWMLDERQTATNSVTDYDIAAGTAHTVTRSAAQLVGSPRGVAWTDAQGRTHVLGGASPFVVPAVPGSHRDLVTDGRTYAWSGSTGISWHDTATKQTVVVRGFPGRGLRVDVLAVSGPYVLIAAGNDGTSNWLIDIRTGAAASFDGTIGNATGDGVLAYTSHGTVILHTDRLPSLHC